jgi:hypothetical protein
MIKYPTEWKGGKPRGSISETKTGYMVRFSPNGKKQPATYFIVKNPDAKKQPINKQYDTKEEAFKSATNWMKQASDENNMTRNQYRYINKNTIEVQLTNDQIMKTDAKFIEQVELYPLQAKHKDNKYYVVYQDKKKTGQFTSLIVPYKITDYINGDSLDLRECNLKELCNNLKEKPDKIIKPIIDTKICVECKCNLSVAIFNKKNGTVDGLNEKCNPCIKMITDRYNKEYRLKYQTEKKLEQTEYYESHLEETVSKNKKDRCEQLYNKFVTLTEYYGGTCLSTLKDYNTALSKLKIKCGENHIFEISLNNLSKKENHRWCPHCKLNQGEIICKYTIEKLSGKEFKKIRPEWLKYQKGNLELDMYNDELKLAIEMNGIQHYEYTPHFHKVEADFQRNKERDKFKSDKCKEYNINLIIVPYTILNSQIPQFIENESIKLNYKFLNMASDINFKDCFELKKKLLAINKKLIEKNGLLISNLDNTIIDTKETRFEIKCNKDHQWETTMFNLVTRNLWCPKCGTMVSEDKKKSISKGMTEFLSTDEGKEVKANSFVKRSITMQKQKEEIRLTITDKQCSGQCKATKNVSEFGKKTDTKDGYQPYCRACVKIAKQKSKKN